VVNATHENYAQALEKIYGKSQGRKNTDKKTKKNMTKKKEEEKKIKEYGDTEKERPLKLAPHEVWKQYSAVVLLVDPQYVLVRPGSVSFPINEKDTLHDKNWLWLLGKQIEFLRKKQLDSIPKTKIAVNVMLPHEFILDSLESDDYSLWRKSSFLEHLTDETISKKRGNVPHIDSIIIGKELIENMISVIKNTPKQKSVTLFRVYRYRRLGVIPLDKWDQLKSLMKEKNIELEFIFVLNATTGTIWSLEELDKVIQENKNKELPLMNNEKEIKFYQNSPLPRDDEELNQKNKKEEEKYKGKHPFLG